MKRAALFELIQPGQRDLEKLLTLLRSAPSGRDRFVSHLYRSLREYHRTYKGAGKSGKQIDIAAQAICNLAKFCETENGSLPQEKPALEASCRVTNMSYTEANVAP
jgi:uncharacterized Fe-S cluster protein YjdI